MKMTRILASLLCIMMVVCALPMMASAAGSQVPPASAPFNLGAAVADVMNEINGNEAYTWARPTNDDDVVNWAPLNIDFTADGMEGLEYSTEALDGVTFDSENGMTFPETEGAWRYFPAAENKCGNTSYWGPGSDNGYYAYSFKVQEGGKLMSWGAMPWTYNVAHITATPTSVTIKSSNGEGSGVNDDALVTYTEAGTAYAPGTEWNDVLVHVVSAKTPYQVWMKKSGDTTFTKIAEAQFPANVNGNGGSGKLNWGFGNDYTTTKKGLTFVGTSANVGYAANYKGVNLSVYQSIDDILGQETGSTYSFEFDENTNFTNSTGRTGFTATGYKSEADGLTLVDPADSSSIFCFKPFGSYSPLNGLTNWNDQTYERQALYIKAKGGFTLQAAAPKIYGRVYMTATPGSEVWAETSANNYSYPLTIQDEWTEYLIVPKDTVIEGWTGTTGYKLYVKGEKSTGGLWYLVKDYGYGKPTTGYSNMALSFYGVTGHIKSVKTLALAKSVSNATATPEGANYLYYNEEFDATPAYSNLTTGGTVDGSGNLLFATTKSSMDYNVNGLEIPVGGYAEFKAQYDGIVKYDFLDGEKSVTITQQSDYGTVTGGTGYCGNNNTSWATWRIVRTENGYNIYSRNEGDNGWVQHAVSTGAASTKAAAVKMNFGTRNGSTEEAPITGDSKLAYLKVYGPAPTSALTVTDGYTATPVASGATLAYPASLRAIATPETGKLLVVSYKGNDMAKAQIVNVADMANDSVFVDATADGADSVKVFLWDGFSGLNRLAPVVTLGL